MRKLAGDRLLVATHNKGKLAEFADLLAPFGITCVSAAQMSLLMSYQASWKAR